MNIALDPLANAKIGYLRGVQRLEVPSVWPEAYEVLAPALARAGLTGLFEPDDILSRLTDCRWQLWVFEVDHEVRTACLTTIEIYPRAKVLRILAIAGEGHGHWPDWFRDIEMWAKSEGCRFIRSEGRDGWAKIMESAGLKKIGAVYSKGLCDG
jgi:hypothetical protein